MQIACAQSDRQDAQEWTVQVRREALPCSVFGVDPDVVSDRRPLSCSRALPRAAHRLNWMVPQTFHERGPLFVTGKGISSGANVHERDPHGIDRTSHVLVHTRL